VKICNTFAALEKLGSGGGGGDDDDDDISVVWKSVRENMKASVTEGAGYF
jgi:hypothetical protein